MIEVYLIFISLILATIGIYLSFRNWVLWKEADPSTLKAKVFLDKSFLKWDFKFTMFMVGLVSLHIIIEYMELIEIFPESLDIVYYAIFPAVLLILVSMQYKWFALLHRKIFSLQK